MRRARHVVRSVVVLLLLHLSCPLPVPFALTAGRDSTVLRVSYIRRVRVVLLEASVRHRPLSVVDGVRVQAEDALWSRAKEAARAGLMMVILTDGT